MVLPNVAIGDIVALFAGGNVPFLLRNSDIISAYRLVSGRYVDGIMFGEAMELGKLDADIFRLFWKTSKEKTRDIHDEVQCLHCTRQVRQSIDDESLWSCGDTEDGTMEY